MKSIGHSGLAQRYIVDDLPGASQLGARLNGILLKIDAGQRISEFSQHFLTSNGLHALANLVNDQAGCWDTFQRSAEQERSERIQQALERAVRESEELAERDSIMAAAIRETFAAKANDPILRQKREAKELRTRFNLGYVEPEHYRRVITLLKRVASEQRLNPDDVAWLITEAGCWMDELRQAWHSLEAAALTKLWENGGFPWDAVNASGHWRKAAKPEKALSLTEAAMAKVGDDPKLRSALATTRGGAMRDLHRLEEAKSLAMEAHKLTPADFRPCTLLGAVHFELGDDAAALEWYKKS